MIEDLDKYLTGIALGIKFRANFSIEDQLGKIIDQILYSDNAFFDSRVFPLVYFRPSEKILVNEKSNDSLIINNSNIVLEINFGSTFQKTELNDILKGFEIDIINGIMKGFNLPIFRKL